MDLVDRDGGAALTNRIRWQIMPLPMGTMMLSVIDRSNANFDPASMLPAAARHPQALS